jgi:hypothetical protein
MIDLHSHVFIFRTSISKHLVYWVHTVRLTLSLQHSSELILLLMPEALPLLEHLNVTIEQSRKDLIYKRGQSIQCFELCEKDLRCTNATGTKLRSFVLRQIELDDLLILFNTLTFPLLHTLTLVDIYDKCKCDEIFLVFLKYSITFLMREVGKTIATESVPNCESFRLLNL